MRKLLAAAPGLWLLPGEVCPEVGGKRGYYVCPDVLRTDDHGLGEQETFSPHWTVETFADLAEASTRYGTVAYGLTASIFTASEDAFRQLGDQLEVGNLYRICLPPFSPRPCPLAGWAPSGNGKPGARGFIRFAADEQRRNWRSGE